MKNFSYQGKWVAILIFLFLGLLYTIGFISNPVMILVTLAVYIIGYSMGSRSK